MTDEKKKQAKKSSHEVSTPVKPELVEEKETFKGIVRLAGKDIRGHVKLRRALAYVRGIGVNLSYSISHLIESELNITPESRIGDLSESQIEKIDKVLFSVGDYNIPKYLLNRRMDFFDGKDKHTIMNDLIFAVKQDIDNEKKIFTWKGYRHSYGQKVRGQRTRNTGRTGMAVGVLRKTIAAAGAAAAGKEGAAAGGAGKPAGGTPAGGAAPKTAEKPAAGGGAKAPPTKAAGK